MKHVQIRLEQTEVAAFEKKWKERGYDSQQAAGKEALLEWCSSARSPFGEITKAEERTLRNVLAVLRNKTDRGERYRKLMEAAVDLALKAE